MELIELDTMKRSRRSEYDKKRNRSKKHSERKFTYAKKETETHKSVTKKLTTKESSRKATEKKKIANTAQKEPISTATFTQKTASIHPIDYEVFSKNDKKYRQRTSFRRKRSILSRFKWPLIIIAIFVTVNLIMKLIHSEVTALKTSKVTVYEETEEVEVDDEVYELDTSESFYERERRLKFERMLRTDASVLIVGTNVKLIPKRVTKDFVKRVLPNVTVQLPKVFTQYNTNAFPKLVTLAKDSIKYFFHESEKIIPSKTMYQQWRTHRDSYINDDTNDYFYDEYLSKNRENNSMDMNSSYIYKGFVLYGAAILIEHNNRYHYFQYMEKKALDDKPHYKEVRKKLNTYLKIEIPDA
ncbi:MAG: hypothetical protein AAF617_04760 [Bacteroidota bacterium]